MAFVYAASACVQRFVVEWQKNLSEMSQWCFVQQSEALQFVVVLDAMMTTGHQQILLEQAAVRTTWYSDSLYPSVNGQHLLTSRYFTPSQSTSCRASHKQTLIIICSSAATRAPMDSTYRTHSSLSCQEREECVDLTLNTKPNLEASIICIVYTRLTLYRRHTWVVLFLFFYINACIGWTQKSELIWKRWITQNIVLTTA
jgi:hypothetical protein